MDETFEADVAVVNGSQVDSKNAGSIRTAAETLDRTMVEQHDMDMGATPLVSILCTTYKHEKFIREALDGFLMQRTTFPFEVIVHDDASPDDTAAIIREYAALHPDIIRPIFQTVNQFSSVPGRVVRLVNEAARGRYIALCEGDDHWTDPLKLQRQVAILENDPSVSGVFHFTEQCFEGMEGTGRLFGSHEGKLRFTAEDTFTSQSLCHYSAFMHRWPLSLEMLSALH